VIDFSFYFEQEIIGDSGEGFRDGDFLHSQFSNPQGIAFQNETLFYVADTGNHAVRRVIYKSNPPERFNAVVNFNGLPFLPDRFE